MKSAYQSQLAKGEAARKADDEQHRKIQTDLLSELNKVREVLERERTDTAIKIDQNNRDRSELEHSLKQHQTEHAAREHELTQELSDVKGMRLAEQKDKELRERDDREYRDRTSAQLTALQTQISTAERDRFDTEIKHKSAIEELTNRLTAAKTAEIDAIRKDSDSKEQRAATAIAELKSRATEREETLKRDIESAKRKVLTLSLSLSPTL